MGALPQDPHYKLELRARHKPPHFYEEVYSYDYGRADMAMGLVNPWVGWDGVGAMQRRC